MPNEESVLTLMGSVAMDHKAFDRALPNIIWAVKRNVQC